MKDTVSLIHVPTRGNDMATIEEQIELEYRMVQSGIDRYNKQKDDLLSKGLGAKTVHGRTIVSGVVEPVSDAIKLFLSSPSSNRAVARKLIEGMNVDTLAFLSLITIIDTISSYHTLIKVARLVGTQVETQKRLDLWLKEEGNTATNMIKAANKKSDKGFDHKRHGLNHKMKADGVDIPYWTHEEKIHVGLKLIDLVIQTTGIVKLETRKFKRRQANYLVPTSETLEWIRAFNEKHECALPRFSPCIVEPKKWEKFYGGGYYSDHIHRLPLVRVHK